VLCLHSTADVIRPDLTIRLDEIAAALATVDRILVHSVHDLNRLKRIGLVDNVALFPMGLPQPFAGDIDAIRARHRLHNKSVVASFGYLLPHKGLRELLAAFALLLKARPDSHLLMLNALYPAPESDAECEVLKAEIAAAGLTAHVSLVTDFLPEADVIERLGAADVVVYPYQYTQESASAAVKIGLAALTPIACTPLDIFADISSVSYTLPGLTPDDIATGLKALLAKPDGLADLRDRQRKWVAAHEWSTLSRRLGNMIRGEVRAQAAQASKIK
jgi:glycosyltransferase involved in cell wall biosynthesis